MKNYLQSLLLLCIVLLGVTTVNAQSKLIHYWHFNNFTTAPASTTVNSAHPFNVHADYSSIDTSKAQIVYMTSAGTSSAFSTTVDYANPGDTLNARMGHDADGSTISWALRPRNRSDSMELRFYIPTTHYKNILIKYISQSSSVGSGMLHQVFDYSTDSGSTWKTTGLSVTGDSAGLSFGPIFPVSFTTDTTVNNNPKLVFRIKFQGNASGTSGNNRFDNITVEGDTVVPASTGGGSTDTAHVLVHYWNFNNFTTVYHNPDIPAMKADYSVLDTNITAIVYKLLPGTSSSYAGYIDNYPVTPSDNDVNERMIASAATPDGNSYRFRNPTDSAYLLLYMPSINYKNLVIKYAVETSSFGSGMLQNLYAYSTDSGATWKTSGLSITSDTTTLLFSLKTIVINDTAAYNNPRFVFKITPQGNTSKSSGNNRFDNITLDGVVIDTAFHYHPHGTAVATVNANKVVCALYPNPANSTVYVSVPAEGSKTIAIYSVTGQRVYMTNTNEKIAEINVANLANGMYYLNVRTANGFAQTLKFVKQ